MTNRKKSKKGEYKNIYIILSSEDEIGDWIIEVSVNKANKNNQFWGWCGVKYGQQQNDVAKK